MFSLLLAVIYLSFISLGLPDSLLGSAWPSMRLEMNVPLSYAGIVSTIIAVGTIVSSLFSDMLTRKLGTGLVTAISVAFTAGAMLGFSFSGEFWMLCVFAVPYGLGAGSVDAALNNYVALHYKSRHLNWLHCFWGAGAAVSPYIMGFSLSRAGWEGGYRTVFIIQAALSAALFLSIPLWKKRGAEKPDGKLPEMPVKLSTVLKLKGVKLVLLAFFAYCAFESTAFLWASSYLYGERGINEETTAMLGSLFFIGLTAGRLLSGFISERVGDKLMIRGGLFIAIIGITAVLLPLSGDAVCLAGLVLTGLGCAPVYPAIIHSTPKNFGEENSQAVIGMQMACAYTGIALMPPLFGLIADKVSLGLFPVFLLLFALLTLATTEMFNLVPVKPGGKPDGG